MHPEVLAAALGRDDCPLIIDVRSGVEFRAGHIPGAVHLPFWKVPGATGSLAEPQAVMVLTCEHGPRAQLALGYLRLRGFCRLTLLKGHMHRWRRLGLPLQQGR